MWICSFSIQDYCNKSYIQVYINIGLIDTTPLPTLNRLLSTSYIFCLPLLVVRRYYSLLLLGYLHYTSTVMVTSSVTNVVNSMRFLLFTSLDYAIFYYIYCGFFRIVWMFCQHESPVKLIINFLSFCVFLFSCLPFKKYEYMY